MSVLLKKKYEETFPSTAFSTLKVLEESLAVFRPGPSRILPDNLQALCRDELQPGTHFEPVPDHLVSEAKKVKQYEQELSATSRCNPKEQSQTCSIS